MAANEPRDIRSRKQGLVLMVGLVALAALLIQSLGIYDLLNHHAADHPYTHTHTYIHTHTHTHTHTNTYIPSLLTPQEEKEITRSIIAGGPVYLYSDSRAGHNTDQSLGERVGFNKTIYGPRGCPIPLLALNPHPTICRLIQRFDIGLSFFLSGGSQRLREDSHKLLARTHTFRSTYFYNNTSISHNVSAILHNKQFLSSAASLYNASIVEPYIVFGNFLLEGQLIATHTDVPAFRGMDRYNTPEWLLTAMHGSKLFEEYRIKIATGVSWWTLGDKTVQGGEIALYTTPGGSQAELVPPMHNTGIVMDTDTVPHGVRIVVPDDWKHSSSSMYPKKRFPDPITGNSLTPVGSETLQRWDLKSAEGELLRSLAPGGLRVSLSWKAYCYTDETERQRVTSHSHDLTREYAIRTLINDLQVRGKWPQNENELVTPVQVARFAYRVARTHIPSPDGPRVSNFN